MSLKRMIVIATIAAITTLSTHCIEAVTYVTDTGGYAYDESRAITNLAPAIGLATVGIVGIIAIAVQNSHGSSSSSSHYGYGYHSDCSSSSSSRSSCYSGSKSSCSYSRSSNSRSSCSRGSSYSRSSGGHHRGTVK